MKNNVFVQMLGQLFSVVCSFQLIAIKVNNKKGPVQRHATRLDFYLQTDIMTNK